MGPKFKKLNFANMFDHKFDQYRTEVCPEIEKIKYKVETLLFYSVRRIPYNSPLEPF